MTKTNIGTVTVNNGVASIQLDTSELAEGTYNIITRYNENDNYKESTINTELNIIEETTQHTINIDDWILEDGTLSIIAITDATIPEDFIAEYPTEDAGVLGEDYNILLLIRTNTQQYYIISLDAGNITAMDETVNLELNKFTTTYSNFDILGLNYSSNPDLIADIAMRGEMVAMDIFGIDGTDAEIYFCLATPTEVITNQTDNWDY